LEERKGRKKKKGEEERVQTLPCCLPVKHFPQLPIVIHKAEGEGKKEREAPGNMNVS